MKLKDFDYLSGHPQLLLSKTQERNKSLIGGLFSILNSFSTIFILGMLLKVMIYKDRKTIENSAEVNDLEELDMVDMGQFEETFGLAIGIRSPLDIDLFDNPYFSLEANVASSGWNLE